MAELDFMQEVNVRKAKMLLAEYRHLPRLHGLALRALVRLAYDGGDIEAAAFRAALALAQEEACEGYNWAANQRAANRPVTKVEYERRIA
jgi:hypothetical protein